jgi:outer membrane receptor protein involved in Fe transport
MVFPSRRIAQGLVGIVLAACAHTTQAAAAAAPDAALPVAIAAQPLPQALDAFADATGLQLIYVAELAQGRTSRSVSPGLKPPAALARMLEGTGLDFVFLNSRTVKIFATPRRAPAQDALSQERSPEGAGSSTAELEQVVVTADKREEAIGAVPISVAVLSADQLDAMGVKNISDIASLTPGLQFNFESDFGPGVLTNIAIRGISTGTGSPTIGIYVDDVPIQASLNVFRNAYPLTFDLARVEVLRGPQGTLFGTSALNGAIRYITNDASVSEFSGLSRLEVAGTQQGGTRVEVGAAGGGPIVPDLLGGRISAWYQSDGGYIDRIDPFDNATIDKDANRSTSRAVRLGFDLEPTETLRIVPSVAYQAVDLHDSPAFYTPLSNPDRGLFLSGKLLRQPYQDTFTLSSLKIQQRFANLELTGVTAYFDRTATAIYDETNSACVQYFGSCGNPLGPAYPSSYLQAVPDVLAQQQSAFSQELRLASTASDARVSWVAGLFYWRTHQNGTADAYAITAPTTPGIYSATRYFAGEISAFGQVYWTPFARWRIGIGARRGWVRGDSTGFQTGFATAGPQSSQTVGTFQPLPATPRFDLSYNAEGLNMLYIAVAKGARAGGDNNTARCDDTEVPASFGSDAIWNYELGAKDLLFDRRLQITTSVFVIRWDGIQESIADDCNNHFTTNAGAATSSGFDLAADALLTEQLRLHLALGLTDAHYDRTVFTIGGQVVADRGTAIGALPSVPSPWSGTVSAQYRRPLTPDVVGYMAADDIFASHNPGPFTENDPRATSYSPGFRADPATNRLNLRLGLIRSSLDIRLSLDNVLNSAPILQLNSDAPGSSLWYAYTFRPRTLGLSCDWKY